MLKKKSFFERLTGGIKLSEDEESDVQEQKPVRKDDVVTMKGNAMRVDAKNEPKWAEEESEGELSIDLYQTPTEIVIHTMVAGVQPENLSITITRDMVTIKGKREENRSITEDNYFVKELYWGAFSRTLSLPEEIDPEEAEAIEKHGLLIIKLPKINKNRQTSLKVRSL